jgi:UDP:flavonoid glycosyltransferase YjiC (YdhE family)
MRIVVAPGVGPGRIFPLLDIAAELAARGHRVDFYAEPNAAKAARAAGCHPFALSVGATYRGLLECTTTRQAVSLFGALAERAAPELLALLRRRRADLVVTDVLHLGAGLAAERSGIRWASVATSPALLSPDVGRIAQALVPTTALRRTLGLQPTFRDSLKQATSPTLHLLPWTKDFDLSTPPRQSVHVGPLGWEPPRQRLPRWATRWRPKAPGVLVSVSTLPFRALRDAVDHYVSEAIRALNELPVEAIITLGDEQYAVATAPARHVRVVRFVPHGPLMPRLSALVTHGGWGTIGRALRSGVPMVVVPFALDQPQNARLCEERGLGFAIDHDALTAEELYDRLLHLVLKGSPEAARASALGRRWAKLSPARLAADRLLSL